MDKNKQFEQKLLKAIVAADKKGDKKAASHFAEMVKAYREYGMFPTATRPKALYGKDAISKVEEMIGRPANLIEKRVAEEEGFVPELYKDDKGVLTYGVGQTGEWIKKGFTAALDHHIKRAKKRVSNFQSLPEYLQAELVQSEYRGDLGGSPTAVRLFNEGKYEQAAKEFLNHSEYKERKAKGEDGVTRRMEATSSAILRYGQEVGDE